MVGTLLCSLALLGAGDRDAYEAAQAQVGRDPDAHVKLALWCEQHGMTAERAKHLALAVLTDPTNAVARGLMGFVQYQGGWRRPDDVAAKVKADAQSAARFAEYTERRARAKHTADGQWKLALWCEEEGLSAEALAHFSATLRHDPNHDGARRRLGYKKLGGRWVTDAQLAAEKANAEAQRKADRHWKPRLLKWRDALADKAKRAAAERALEEVTDPRAVPSIWEVFASGGESAQMKAVQLFGQIHAPVASRALAALAVRSRWGNVRQVATETLRQRDAREFVGLLVGSVRTPIKYQVREGPTPAQGAELVAETERFNIRRAYVLNPQILMRNDLSIINYPTFMPARIYDASVPFEPFSAQNMWLASQPLYVPGVGAPGVHQNQAAQAFAPELLRNDAAIVAARRDLQIGITQYFLQQAANAGRQRLTTDVATLDAINAESQASNALVLPVLNAVTGEDLGDSQDAWQTWWSDQNGLVYDVPSSDSKPTFTEIVPNPVIALNHYACFGIGTAVRTLNGLRPIESIRPGDQVLTQNVHSGTLAFEPVLAIYHNKPAATLKLALDGESVVATRIHRFWKAGQGWVMARDLKAGDSIRTVGGVARVSAVDDAPVQPVFNLEVASGQSFFVGQQGALVHDNSLVQPETEPFDAAPALTPTTSR